MTLPTFLVVGAPRCGTTSLHYYLQQHPQICMSSIKEPNYFLFDEDGEPFIAEPAIIRKSVRTLPEYTQLFRRSPEQQAVGEISPLYLSVRQAPDRILATCGQIPVVALVRSPADRAWSHFLHAFPEHGDDATAAFAEMVRAEMAGGHADDESYRTRTHLVRVGLYAEQVQRHRDAFGDDRVLVLLMDDLDDATDATLARICEHVGVDAGHRFEASQKFNLSGTRPTGVKGALRQAVRKVQPTVKAVLPPSVAGRLGRLRVAMDDRTMTGPAPLDPALRSEINEWCRADIERLATMIDRDLSGWLAPPDVELAG
jgi:hypothetical protein